MWSVGRLDPDSQRRGRSAGRLPVAGQLGLHPGQQAGRRVEVRGQPGRQALRAHRCPLRHQPALIIQTVSFLFLVPGFLFVHFFVQGKVDSET